MTVRTIDPAIERLARHIRHHGPIQCVRVSSAQAAGEAKKYAYWGAARYEIANSRATGLPVVRAREAARSDRRSFRLAIKDAERIARNEHRLPISWWPMRMTEAMCQEILDDLSADSEALQAHSGG